MLLDAALFEPSSFTDQTSLESALQNVSQAVGAAAIEQTLENLLRRPYLAEFIWSASSRETAEHLTVWVVDKFPLHPTCFFGSIAEKLLSQFSISLLHVGYPVDIPANLEKFRQDVLIVFPVLEALSFFHQNPTMRSSAINVELFQTLKLAPPTTRAEATKTGSELLLKLRRILQYYINILRRSNLTTAFASLCMAGETHIIRSASPGTSVTVEKYIQESPESYMAVQPMSAMLYFENAKGFGDWKVLISARTETDLRHARRQDGEAFILIVKKIRDLSNGRFSADNQKPLTGSDVDIPIFEAKMTGDTHLAYYIQRLEPERQVRILGIYPGAELDSLTLFWTSLGKQLSRMEKRRKTKRYCTNNSTNTTFAPYFGEEARRESLSDSSIPDDDLDQLHSLLVLNKFIYLSQPLLYSMWVDLNVAHVFELVPEEKEIIEHNSSCYVIGRSGTGKTTTMLFKMLSRERSCRLSSPSTTRPRQLFVTQSRMLADKVEKYFKSLSWSMEAAELLPSELNDLAAREKLNRGTKPEEEEEEEEEEVVLVDTDDRENWRESLPRKFSLLQDHHFPLFITYDRLCALIEANITLSSDWPCNSKGSPKPVVTQAEGLLPPDYMCQHSGSFVSFEIFLGSYWNHFPQPLTKGLDPALVFGEFMGVIKGSEKALDSPRGFLDRQTYTSLGYRSQATFANRRDQIYDLFENYLKLKRDTGDRDAADRTRRITKYIREHGVPGQKIDYMYVDEVQDNLLIDSLVLRLITQNRNGLFWAGDTAQTIAVGSAFRFTDLKAFQHNIEEKINHERLKPLPVSQPKEFQLSVNFRSHAGIVQCAFSVITLLRKLWPDSIDALSAEEGIVDGKKPIFYTRSGSDTANSTIHFESPFVEDSGAQIEFGAQQCIIVRDDIAKKRLRQVGDPGLVLTVYESKGLEFDDVLLWNFFQDSTANSSQWRVVLNEVDWHQRNRVHPPDFDAIKHAGICSELKFLYVAITRSRKHLWIFDNSENAEPMKLYWASKGRVEILDPSSTNLRIAVKSSKEEWAKQGQDLFHNKRYSAALHAFNRAGCHRDAAVAAAYELRRQAQLAPAANREEEFGKAACAFMKCGEDTNSRKTEHERVYLKIAAECWANSGDNLKAAETFLTAEQYEPAAEHYRRAKMYEEVVNVLRNHATRIGEKVATELMHDAKKFFFQEDKLEKGLDLFESDEEALEFMKEFCEPNRAQARLLEKLGRNIEAAEVHLAMNKVSEAVRLFGCVLAELWQRLSFGTSWRDSDIALTRELEKSSRGGTKSPLTSDYKEILMFKYICAADPNLCGLGQDFYESDNIPAALLCFHHVFAKTLIVEGTPYPEITKRLRLFSKYIHLLDDLRSLANSDSIDTCQRLFGFRYTNHNCVIPSQSTFLHSHASGCKDDEDFVLPTPAFQEAFARSLLQYTRARVTSILDGTLATSLTPCIDLITTGHCDRSKCRSLHIAQDAATLQWYNDRIDLLVQQLHLLKFLIPEERLPRERALMDVLYDVLHPPVYKLGSQGNIVPLYISYADEGFRAIKESISNVCRTLAPVLGPGHTVYDARFPTVFMRVVTMAFAFDGNEALSYLPKWEDGHQCPHRFTRAVLDQFLSSLQADSQNSILDGIKYLRFVFANKIEVDAGAICDFMDWLAGFIVVSSRFYKHGSLHHVVLPRTWFLALSRVFNKLSGKNGTGVVESFLKVAQVLLTQLESSTLSKDAAAHLTFQEKSFPNADLRGMYISRVCRCICLLGNNIPDGRIKQQVLHIINSLSDRTHPLYTMYVSATRWGELRVAAHASTAGPSLDEIICLRHAARQKEPVPTPRSIRSDCVYWRMDEIATCLAFGPKPSITYASHSTLVQSLLTLWDVCCVELGTTDWSSRRRKLPFLGPREYFCLYLEEVDDYIYSVLEEQPLQQGNVAQITDLKVVFERMVKLRDLLTPTMDLAQDKTKTSSKAQSGSEESIRKYLSGRR